MKLVAKLMGVHKKDSFPTLAIYALEELDSHICKIEQKKAKTPKVLDSIDPEPTI
jgi:hypothetical protein